MNKNKTWGISELDYLKFSNSYLGIIKPNSNLYEEEESTDVNVTKYNYYFHGIINNLLKRITDLEEHIEKISNNYNYPLISSSKIYNLPVKDYELTSPIDVSLEFYKDEVIALIPDLELYGDGKNQIDALNDLKFELIDLFEHLEEEPDDKLGDQAYAWKKTLNSLIKICK